MERKNLIKGSLVMILAFIFFLGILSGPVLAGSKYKDFPVPKECMDQVRKEGNKLFIYDWAEWWPEELFKNFTKEFGVQITRDHFADTEEMITKFKLNPKTPYDLVTGAGPSGAVRLNKLGVLRELNHDWLPNVDAYLMDEYKNMDFDPGNHFQLIDTMFLTTYGYNSKYIDPNDPLVGSWALLFEGAEKYKGKVTMIDNFLESIGTALKYLGYSWTSDNEKELMEAKDLLMKQKPYLRPMTPGPGDLLLRKRHGFAIRGSEMAGCSQRMCQNTEGYCQKRVPTLQGIPTFSPRAGNIRRPLIYF